MQIGMVGLGRMGANMAHRLMNGGHSCAVKNDGSVWCWGLDVLGQTGNATTGSAGGWRATNAGLIPSAQHVSLGQEFTCALTRRR